MLVGGIANILHRDTIAVIVGTKTFERGERCFAQGRVVTVEATRGELRGVVKPNETGRSPYRVHIWVREDGLAYECTCPVGSSLQFCKHTVAIALAHLERERTESERRFSELRGRLLAMSPSALVEKLLGLAREHGALFEILRLVAGDHRQ
ncbi:MAG TPA: hypothetical protein VFQ53_24655 [Kofleriaceae bacterium]|nr:hypothetical protein [Kofleriaceae bacterium]